LRQWILDLLDAYPTDHAGDQRRIRVELGLGKDILECRRCVEMAVDIGLRQAGQPGDRLKQCTLGMALLLRLGDVMRIHLRQGQGRHAFVVRKAAMVST